MALMEYENCVILKDQMLDSVGERIDKIKLFLYPETRIIKTCLEKGGEFYTNKDFRTSNKYFSKVMLLSNENSSEYKFAKSKVVENI